MTRMLEKIKVDDEKNEFNFNFGAVYDVTGEGFYVDPEDWVNGRSGNQGKPGCKDPEYWCKTTKSKTYIPSHMYVIIRHTNNRTFSALLPWRLASSRYTCRIV